MEQFFIQIVNLCAEYMWVILAAMIIVSLMPQPDPQKQAMEEFEPDNTHGDATFADSKKLRKAGLFGSDGIHLGYSPDGRHKLFYHGVGHLFLCAPARSGKMVTIIANILLELWTSAKNRRDISGVLIFDPKAELVSIFGRWMARFGKTYVLNPDNIHPEGMRGLKQARFNAMDILDTSSPSFHQKAMKLASIIIREEEGKNKFFSDAARILFCYVMCALKRHGAPEQQNLVEIAKVIMSGDGLHTFCRNAMRSSDPYIVQGLRRYAFTPSREHPVSDEMRSVISTAIANLGWITGAIAENMKSSDFRLTDLKMKRGTTLFVCLKLSTLDVNDQYFSLLWACVLTELLDEQKGAGRVLAVIDEADQLRGHAKAISNALGMGAGAAGLQMFFIFQNWAQAVGMLGNRASSFLQNSGVTMWFRANDPETRDMVSKLSGTREIISAGISVSPDRKTGAAVVNLSGNQQSRALVLPHEAGSIGKEDEMFMFWENVNGVIRAKRRKYFECPEYRGKYRANPYFKKN